MAAFWNLDQSHAVNNGYYNIFITPFTFHHQNPMMPLLIGDKNAPTFGYYYADTENSIYSHYWVLMYPQGFYYNHNVINPLGFLGGPESNYYRQFMPCDDSWILGNGQEVNHPGFSSGEEANNYHQFMPCDESWISDAQEEEEEELNEEELRVMNSFDQDVVVYDTTYDDEDDSLSEEIVTRHLKTRDHHVSAVQDTVDDQICVVCQDCLFQENEKIATLDCGHEYHAGCLIGWLMCKNCCPLCNVIGICL